MTVLLMSLGDTLSRLTEEDLTALLERYRAFGPFPGILLTFAKSFVPPLPTIVIVGVNAAVYGLWLGFLYSWIGIVAGCLTTFLIVRKIAGHRYMARWAGKPAVRNGMLWVRRNGFSYVFLLSLFPVGPFVVINIAAGLAGMRLRSFAIAIAFGKAVMVLAVSFIGHDVMRFWRNPAELAYVVAFVVVSWWISKRIEARFARGAAGDAPRESPYESEGDRPTTRVRDGRGEAE